MCRLKLSNFRFNYHRNGISGEGFHIVLFDDRTENARKPRRMVGVVFEGGGRVAVFDVDELSAGDIDSAWRGELFGPYLRDAIVTGNTLDDCISKAKET